MAIKTSGPIGINADIVAELGGAAPHGLSEYYNSAENAPVSGQIAIGDFYGLSAPPAEYPLYNTGTNPLWPTRNDIPYGGRSILNSANVNNGGYADYTQVPGNTTSLSVVGNTPGLAFPRMWSWDVRWSINLSSIPAYLRGKRISFEFSGRTSGSNNGTSFDLLTTAYYTNASGGRVNTFNWKPTTDTGTDFVTVSNTVQQYIDGSANGLIWLGHSAGGDGSNNSLSGDSTQDYVSSTLGILNMKLVN